MYQKKNYIAKRRIKSSISAQNLSIIANQHPFQKRKFPLVAVVDCKISRCRLISYVLNNRLSKNISNLTNKFYDLLSCKFLLYTCIRHKILQTYNLLTELYIFTICT